MEKSRNVEIDISIPDDTGDYNAHNLIHIYTDLPLGYHLGYLGIRLSGWKIHEQVHLDTWS